ncbi:MAG: T9SS C-terminal target domain-containing protein, partial [Flavobacteriia bacterium]|nr:T9SS C-terminal target domain-containing protein [Flavobacteriia bacterium]
VDPNGNPTNGITRTFTNVTAFDANGDEKFTASGGHDNWNPTEYLNIWVCNLDATAGTLGYAAFPSELATHPELDGVVIRYEAFGDIGTAGTGIFNSNDLGRTATHEVGHWLNLRHIWGDTLCGDDFVDDTEVAEDANYGCPTFPHNANNQCGSGQDGEMYMNYMDYVDDYCMNMFTYGQALRMNAALNTDRVGLLTSLGCNNSSNLLESLNEFKFDVVPNPSNGMVTVSSSQNTSVTPVVYNLLGAEVKRLNVTSQFPFSLDLSDLPNGIYYLNCINSKASIAKRIVISK